MHFNVREVRSSITCQKREMIPRLITVLSDYAVGSLTLTSRRGSISTILGLAPLSFPRMHRLLTWFRCWDWKQTRNLETGVSQYPVTRTRRSTARCGEHGKTLIRTTTMKAGEMAEGSCPLRPRSCVGFAQRHPCNSSSMYEWNEIWRDRVTAASPMIRLVIPSLTRESFC